MPQDGVDARPRFFDPKSGHFCLVDSGSAVTAIEPGPDDVVRPDLALVAANGTIIECYGHKTIEIKMGRKTYYMKAAIANIEGIILGWDFIKKYKLSFWWDRWGECHLYDRQADIKKLLEFIKIPYQSTTLNSIMVPTVADAAFRDENPRETLFNAQALASIETVSEKIMGSANSADTFSQTDKNLPVPEISPTYKSLLNKYPNVLKTEFQAKSKGQPVIHYIDTAQNKPCNAKLRPLMKGSPKEVKGKEAWMELVEFGIVELVDTSKPTLWTSALHLQPKPSGGLRPCGDFRQLNQKTQMDQYPLPHLQKWTHKLHSAKRFSKLDIRKAYHHLEISKSGAVISL